MRWCGTFLSLLVGALLPPPSEAQQTSPLVGQGVNPRDLGLVNGSVPVYLSVVLVKLLSINEVNYRFGLIADVIVSWRDPRAPGLFQALNVSLLEAERRHLALLDACRKAHDARWPNTSSVCEAAAATPGSCSKPCDPALPGVCCDSLWLPDITLENSAGFSQDRYTFDRMGKGEGDAVFRTVRVQGDFSNTFSFQRFPFDSQVLELPFVANEFPDVVLFPSYSGRFLPELYRLHSSSVQYSVGEEGSDVQTDTEAGAGGGTGWATVSEEVTGWAISTISLNCSSPQDFNRAVTSNIQSGQLDPKDPLVGSLLMPAATPATASPSPSASASGPGPQGSNICFLIVQIDRISWFYIWSDIFPVMLTTLTAFAVFVTSPSAIDVRLPTVVTLFLALVAAQFIIADQLPKTSYMTSFGALVLLCYCVFFTIILESVIVYYLSCLRTFQLEKGNISGHEAAPLISSPRALSSGAHVGRATLRRAMSACQEEQSPRPSSRKSSLGHLPCSLRPGAAPQGLEEEMVEEGGELSCGSAPLVQGHTEEAQALDVHGYVSGREAASGTSPGTSAPFASREQRQLQGACNYCEGDEDGARDGVQLEERPGRAWVGMLPLFGRLLRSAREYHDSLAKDPYAGYRVAATLDWICAPGIFLLFVMGVILCFAL